MKEYLSKLFMNGSLSRSDAKSVMDSMITGDAHPEQIGALLGAYRIKEPSVDEIVGFAESLRSHAVNLPIIRDDIIDTCGTGGDGANTFNISTCVAFVIAAAGIGVCKHGNRSVSSKCGSADVLEELGVPIDLDTSEVAKLIDQVGFGFLFAPKFHPALANVGSVRKKLGVRTIFNILGPLVNPAHTKRQVIGVYDRRLLEKVAEVLNCLGSEEVMVVCGYDGLDEITTTGKTYVAHLKNKVVSTYAIDPKSYGIKYSDITDLAGGNKRENAKIIESVLQGEDTSAKRDVVLLNAAASLYVSGCVSDFSKGIIMASDIIDSGRAFEVLEKVRMRNGK